MSSGKEPSSNELRTAFMAKLKQSLLTAVDAKKLKLNLLSRAQSTALKVLPYAGFKIPYFHLDGKPNAFFRVRYLEDTREGWDKATVSKPMRYSQPPSSGVQLYMPPLLPWPKVLLKPEQQLIITEGELKAACACKLGLPAMALGGVWSFSSKAKGELSLPVFQQLRLANRTIYVVFDSDALTNPQVLRAEIALCRALLALGAVPYVVRLPALAEGAKTGLDDYLRERGADHLTKLLQEALPFAGAAKLHELNEHVAYVRDPGLIVKLDTLQRISTDAFTRHAFSTWSYVEETVKADGGTSYKEQPAAPAWLRWPMRFEVPRMTYAPGEPRFTDNGELNTWPGWGCAPKKGDATPWIKLLDHLFSGQPAERKWFEQWCAYPLQHPGTKLYSASVMWSVRTGVGKSLVGYSLMAVYGRNATEIDDEHLQASYNEWAENKQFVMGDDVTSGENKRHMADKLRSMITRQELRLNPKYIPSYAIRDCINYYFTGNHPDLFLMEEDDRRMFVHEVVVDRLPRAFYKEYDAWLKSEAGPAALFYHLLHVDLKGFDDKGEAMLTEAKAEMIDVAQSDLARWVREVAQAPDRMLGSDTGDLWTPHELVIRYDPNNERRISTSAMGRELRRARLARPYHRVVQTKMGSVRLIIVRHAERWVKATHAALAEHYNASRSVPKDERKTKKYTKQKLTKEPKT